jgi:hypothetical protein
MDRPERQPLSNELEALEAQLAALTLQVAALRNQINEQPGEPTDVTRSPRVGDWVQFFIRGRSAEGVVIGRTAQRIRIRQNGNSHIILRAPHNVIIISP